MAIKELQEAGVDMKRLSIVGRDTHTEEHVVGYYTAGDRMKYWGKIGAINSPRDRIVSRSIRRFRIPVFSFSSIF